jgi:hypothetical protein
MFDVILAVLMVWALFAVCWAGCYALGWVKRKL